MESWSNPFWPTLRGPLRHLAEGRDLAVRFDPEVNVFAALPDCPGPESWDALAALVGPGGSTVLGRTDLDLPAGWTIGDQTFGVQYLAVNSPGVDDAELAQVVELGPADVPEMSALAAATRPGPFLPRTIEQGGFIGIRDHGRLVSIGGYRCQLDDAVEISTVCTATEARGNGYASRLIRALVQRIEVSGRRAILHTGEDNPARGLYESLGFEPVAKPVFSLVRADG